MIGPIISILAAALGSSIVGFILALARKLGQQSEKTQKTHGERIAELTESLMKASTEVDKIMEEFAQMAQEREETVSKLEKDLAEKQKRRRDLQQTLDRLEKADPKLAKDFAELVRPMQKRSAYRDYILFGAGVVLTTLIAILIQVISGGRIY